MKSIIISIIAVVILIGGVFLLNQRGAPKENSLQENNVSIVDGKQIIVIKAKGGYQPQRSVAKAGIPTILRFETGGTFDCSSSVRIPSLNITKTLPNTGTTDIDLGTQQKGNLSGMCGMGMYPFEVMFN